MRKNADEVALLITASLANLRGNAHHVGDNEAEERLVQALVGTGVLRVRYTGVAARTTTKNTECAADAEKKKMTEINQIRRRHTLQA